MTKHLKYLLLICVCCYAQLQAQNVPSSTSVIPTVVARPTPPAYNSVPTNYVRTFAPQIPIQDSGLVNLSAIVENVQTSITYADSYGRTIETITKQLSPSKKDNVAAPYYDAFGRAGSVSYLPFVANTDNGAFVSNPFQQDSAFYKNLHPTEQVIYTQTQYDGSPFNIPIKSMAHGNQWGGANIGKTLTHRASTNADSVRYWDIDIATENDLPTTNSFYTTGSLSVQETTNEDGIKTITYTDLTGKTILTKAQLSSTPSTGSFGWLCTYYVYDEMGKLRVAIPPKAVTELANTNWQLTTTLLQNLCYYYFYDNRGRQIMKSIPSKGKSYTAYDVWDRPVMTQDPNLRTTNQWAFVLYDAQSRPYKSGVITTTLTTESVQAQAALSSNYPTLAGTYTVMTENFYDDYTWVQAQSAPFTGSINGTNINSTNFITTYNAAPDYAQPINSSARIRGAATGTKVLALNTTNYLYTVSYYDKNGRAIQTQQTNITNGLDVATMQYSYAGRLLRSHISTTKMGSNQQTHTILTKYNYDHTGRLLSLAKSIDGTADKTISQYTYLETGQIASKIIAPTSGPSGGALETQTYSYNIRGMLTAINKDYVSQLPPLGGGGAAHFGEIISYANGFAANQTNGNIAGVQWKNSGDNIARAYGYTYDNVGRLTKADFTQRNEGANTYTNDKVDYSVSNLRYDDGGNILSMTQRALLATGGNTIMDSLNYTYLPNSNRLKNITDLAPPFGGSGGLALAILKTVPTAPMIILTMQMAIP